MERYMYQDDSFERMLKQKADEYRMYPSSQIWDKIQQRVQKKNNPFNYKSISITLVLLSFFSLYFSNDQQANNKVSLLLPDDNDVHQTVSKTNAPLAKVIKMKQRVKLPLSEANNESFAVIAPESSEKVLPVDAAPTISVSPVIEQSSAEEIILTKAVDDHLVSFAKPALYAAGATEQKVSIRANQHQTETAFIDESPELKTDAELNYEVDIPLVIKQKPVRQFQVYFTPSVSYRVLYAGNKIAFGNLPQQQNPENAAIHNPSLGLEAGAAILFPISKRVKFRTGIQFNYTHYEVNAFNSAPQLTTIRLNYSSIQRVTTLNNNYGYYAKDVANETYQISIPVGFEFKLAGKKKVQWNLATNLQPSYLLKASGYLLTNDLKNYVKAPDLMSHLNLNSSIETFIRWDAKSFLIQAGPQLRYQVFSNARGEYPIKEHLVDYGFRIGIVKPLR
jgi:hypothetical protein